MARKPVRGQPATVREIEDFFEVAQNRLVIQASDFSLQGLQEMVDEQIIDLAPSYQRRERWGPDRQSQLIESFLLNVPVPPIYLAEEEYGIYSIIDGKQRITSIADFLNNKFALTGLEKFTAIGGLRYRDLPQKLSAALRVRPYLRVITLLKQSDPELKYEVFIRLNRGGIKLNNQEIRNVAFRGHLNDAIYRCAENEFLRRSLKIDGPKSSAYQQMDDAEFVLRFLTLRGQWKTFSGSFVKSMDRFMLTHRNDPADAIAQMEQRFATAIQRVQSIWGNHAFQRWDGKAWRQQALAGMYDAQMIACSEITEADYQTTLQRKGQIMTATRHLFANDKEFEEAVRLGTNTPARIRLRIEKVLEILRGE